MVSPLQWLEIVIHILASGTAERDRNDANKKLAYFIKYIQD